MPQAYEVNQRANGSILVLATDQPLIIQLPENPSTGYRWLMQPCSGMRIDEDTFALGNTDVAGASGIRRLKLSVIASGTHHLTLLHCREWEPSNKAIARFDLTVKLAS